MKNIKLLFPTLRFQLFAATIKWITNSWLVPFTKYTEELLDVVDKTLTRISEEQYTTNNFFQTVAMILSNVQLLVGKRSVFIAPFKWTPRNSSRRALHKISGKTPVVFQYTKKGKARSKKNNCSQPSRMMGLRLWELVERWRKNRPLTQSCWATSVIHIICDITERIIVTIGVDMHWVQKQTTVIATLIRRLR